MADRTLAMVVVAIAVFTGLIIVVLHLYASSGGDLAYIRYKVGCRVVYACPDNVTARCGTLPGAVCLAITNTGQNRIPHRMLERAMFEYNAGSWIANETLVVTGNKCDYLIEQTVEGWAAGSTRIFAISGTRFADYNDIIDLAVTPMIERTESSVCTRTESV